MADYKQNIGAYQPDFANDDKWRVNIGACQTDPPSFEDTDIVVSGAGSVVVSDFTIKVNTEATITGVGSVHVSPTHSNTNNLGHIFADTLFPIIPGWDSACDQGSADIWGPAVPRIIDPLLGVGDLTKVTPATADQTKHDGVGIIRTHEILWYEVAHLLPRLVQDVGNLVTDQTINCELYNADRQDAITVSTITDNLGIGFQVTGVPATPFNIASQESLSFQIKVLQTGDLTIDGTYTLTLSTSETYTISIIGSRIVIIPIRPEAPLKEHLQWQTKIIEASDGGEQRIANRHIPRGMFEMTYKEGRRRMEMILFDRQSKLVAIPAWHEPSYLSSAATAGAYTVNVNTTDYANFYVGGYACVLYDEHTFDVLEIESMTGTSLTFTSDLADSYAIGVQVMPLMTAYIEATTPSVKAVYNDQDIKVKAHVLATDNDIASATGWNTYNSKVFLDDPNFLRGRLPEILETKVFVLDNQTGDRMQMSNWDHGLRRSRKGFVTHSRADLWKLRKLLHYLKGRQVSFYIPTFSKDILPSTTLINSSSTITMANIGYTVNARERWPKQVIRLHKKDGTILVRTIQDSAEVSAAVEQLTVDTAWPYDITVAEIERIEFLEKVRFDTDDITLLHMNALGDAECVVPTREVHE